VIPEFTETVKPKCSDDTSGKSLLTGARVETRGFSARAPVAAVEGQVYHRGRLSGRTSGPLWSYIGPPPTSGAQQVSFGSSARTQSYGNGMVFTGQQDGSVVGLDAKTGAVKWTAQVSGAGVFAGHNSLTAPATTFAPIGKNGSSMPGRTTATRRCAGTWTRSTRRPAP
jgi:outer membrane protein assembly factor BamB